MDPILESLNFRLDDFGLFGKACFTGDLQTVQWVRFSHKVDHQCAGVDEQIYTKYLMTGNAPPLSQKESAYEFGYASLIVTGAQRVGEMPGGAILQHIAVLELLISRGLPLSVPDIGGFTSLHHCIASASQRTNSFDPATKEKAMRKILTSGADVNYRNRWGDTALHNALQRGDTLGIDLLMEYGADIDIPDGNGLAVRNIYLNTGATVAAAMEKWLLKRSGKEKAPMTARNAARTTNH